MTDDAWEELDADGGVYWGVFHSDGYSAEPIAIFGDKRTAEEWVAWQLERPEDTRELCGSECDYCFMEVRDLKGRAWNHVEPAPSEPERRAHPSEDKHG